MPVDPYFTSKSTAHQDYDNDKRKRKAYAKAVQFHMATYQLNKIKRNKAVRRLGKYADPSAKQREQLKRMRKNGKPVFSTGQRSITGFRQPMRVWDTKEQRQKRIDRLEHNG